MRGEVVLGYRKHADRLDRSLKNGVHINPQGERAQRLVFAEQDTIILIARSRD